MSKIHRMSDGRLFTDYRASGLIIPPSFHLTKENENENKLQTSSTWVDLDRKLSLQASGHMYRNIDRYSLFDKAPKLYDDTMVPEQSKRIYTWDGCVNVVTSPSGLGVGRQYKSDISPHVDPDTLARDTAKDLTNAESGTFVLPIRYRTNTNTDTNTGYQQRNKYAAP